MDFTTAKTIYNGIAYRRSAVLGMIYGDIKCTFAVESLNEKNIHKQRAVITSSAGNILTGVNGKSAVDYLEEIGITKADISAGSGVIPLVIDRRDGTKPITRAIYAFTPDGYAVCGGIMPVGATIAIGRINKEDIISTTEQLLKSLDEKDCVVLSYSCLARYLILAGDNNVGADIMIKKTGGKIQYFYACSGGEICPLPDSSGDLNNFFHNFSIAFCILS
jgi:hypothetical protein